MHVVLTPARLGDPSAYPEWCDLSWFQNCRHLTGSIEPHYHDLAEIYLWHEGRATALIDGQPVPMRYGMLAYTAAGAHHSYEPAGMHSNTGITPRALPGCRPGHLHTDETGETPRPRAPSFWVTPEENPFAAPLELPRHCFARRVACARFAAGDVLLARRTEGWLGLLVREGRLSVRADGQAIETPADHLFLASPGVELAVSSVGDAEGVLAEGWPVGM